MGGGAYCELAMNGNPTVADSLLCSPPEYTPSDTTTSTSTTYIAPCEGSCNGSDDVTPWRFGIVAIIIVAALCFCVCLCCTIVLLACCVQCFRTFKDGSEGLLGDGDY